MVILLEKDRADCVSVQRNGECLASVTLFDIFSQSPIAKRDMNGRTLKTDMPNSIE